MKLKNSIVVIRQLDRKMLLLEPLGNISLPGEGWIRSIRTTLNMSLRQLGKKMGVTPQSVRDMETGEKEGTLTLKTLQNAAKALDMKLVYGFIPNDGSIEKMIARRAQQMASEIVSRTSMTMSLEDQGNSEEIIRQAIEDLTNDIKSNIPKRLWD